MRIIPSEFELYGYEIILTWNCNLRCTYCYECQPEKTTSELRETNKEIISSEKIDQVVDFIIQTHAKNAPELKITFWGGEPFLAFTAIEEFISKLEQAQQAGYINKPITYTTTTNLTTLTLTQMKYLRSKNFAMAVSLDGMKNTQDRNRGAGTFAKVVKNMALLHGLGVPFQVCMTISMDTLDELKQNIDFVNSLEHNFWWKFDHTKKPLSQDNIKEVLDVLLDFYNNTRRNYSTTLEYAASKKDKNTFCIDPHRQITIDPEGNLRICSRVDWIIGNIQEGITNYAKIKSLPFYSGRPLAVCEECLIYEYCKGGCIGAHFEKNKDQVVVYELNDSFCKEMFLLQLLKENIILQQKYFELKKEEMLL